MPLVNKIKQNLDCLHCETYHSKVKTKKGCLIHKGRDNTGQIKCKDNQLNGTPLFKTEKIELTDYIISKTTHIA